MRGGSFSPLPIFMLYNQYGESIDLGDVAIVEEMMRLKRESVSDPWPVIGKCIEIWNKKRPTEWKSFLVEVGQVKATRKNEFASTKRGGGGRYLLDIPEYVMLLIRACYTVEELPMNKSFMREFAKKFPIFTVPERL